MGIIRWAWLVIAILGCSALAHGQELKQGGVLKNKEGRILAALDSVAGGRLVVAYVAEGSEGDKAKLMYWKEVRLLDVASGKHRVLVRAATPAALPGIGANYTLLGFTSDGKKLAVSTTDPGGTTKKLLLDIPDFKEVVRVLKGWKLGKLGGDEEAVSSPAVYKSLDEVAKAYPDKEFLGKLDKEVDFSKNVLLRYSWKAGGPPVSYEVKESKEGPIVVFTRNKLRTTDLIPGSLELIIPADVYKRSVKK